MPTAIVTHKDCILHDTGINHPESKERLIAVNKTLKEFKSKKIKWFEGNKVDQKYFLAVHSETYFNEIKKKSPRENLVRIDSDTVLSKYSLDAAFKAASRLYLLKIVSASILKGFSLGDFFLISSI